MISTVNVDDFCLMFDRSNVGFFGMGLLTGYQFHRAAAFFTSQYLLLGLLQTSIATNIQGAFFNCSHPKISKYKKKTKYPNCSHPKISKCGKVKVLSRYFSLQFYPAFYSAFRLHSYKQFNDNISYFGLKKLLWTKIFFQRRRASVVEVSHLKENMSNS